VISEFVNSGLFVSVLLELIQSIYSRCHCPWSGSQCQVTPVAQGMTSVAISMGKICHMLLSLDAG